MINDNISKEAVLNELFSKNRLGIKPGLERTIELCNYIGNPHKKFKSIHIAGTNGKGTVSSSIASILMEAGYKTGLYTSPHLIDFNERIRVNTKLIEDDKLVEYYILLKVKAKEIGATFFEITTAMAFKFFEEEKVEIAVIETGMGGRFDSTNIINPILTIITKIDFDHQEYLGNTIEKITFEKAGIIKQNIPLIVSKNIQMVYDTIQENRKNNEIILSDNEIFLNQISTDKKLISNWSIGNNDFINKNFEFPIPGSFQVDNLKSVLSAIKYLKNIYDISPDNITNGFKNTLKNSGLRARIEMIDQERIIIVDGSHNSGGVENLFQTIEVNYPDVKWNIVFSMMDDKDKDKSFEYIAKFSKALYLPKLKISRASDVNKLFDTAKLFGIENVYTVNSVSEIIEILKDKNHILIFGSFYLAGEFLEIYEKIK